MKKIKYVFQTARGPCYYRRQLALPTGGYRAVYEPIPYEFGTPEFFTEYAKINEKFEKGDAHIPLDVLPKKSLHALIADFLGSTEFNQEIGARTQNEYKIASADIKANMGDGPVKNIGRPEVLFVRDKMAKKWAPSRVNAAINTLRRLLNFSIDRGYGLAHNPALNIKKLKQGKGDGFAPWLPENIDLAHIIHGGHRV